MKPIIATEENFEDWIQDYFPGEIEYEDLGVPVHEDGGEYPSGWNYKTDSEIWTEIPPRDGKINYYTLDLEFLSYEQCVKDILEFLKKDINQVTVDDLNTIDEDDFFEFLYQKYEDKAKEQALEDFDNGKYDEDWVDWIEYEPYEEDPDDWYDRWRESKYDD